MKKIFLVFVFIHLFSFVASCEQTVGKVPQTAEDVFLSEGDRVNVEVRIEQSADTMVTDISSRRQGTGSERPGNIRLIKVWKNKRCGGRS